MNDRTIRLGDIFYADFGDACGHVQRGERPAIVWQNNVGNKYSPNVTVLPVTSVNKRMDIPTHVKLPAVTSGLPHDSVVLCENPMTLSMDKLGNKVGHLPKSICCDIAEGVILASASIALLDDSRIRGAKRKADRLI